MKIAFLCLLLAPALGAFLNGLRWQSKKVKPAGLIGSLACFVSFLSALVLFVLERKATSPLPPAFFFEWLNVSSLKISFSFLAEPLSLLMLLLITGVGFLIHVFSLYYMEKDERPAKYFAYLNLFLLSMIVLVSADNLCLMFLGWEGVGLCSYLLIGFWFSDLQKAKAGMKAFIVNRIGDMGFLAGMFLLFREFGSLDFSTLVSAVEAGAFHLFTVKLACLFLFIGAVGKSAQLPLYIWLPSAMAGPTPVSALIHAATMVTAGVYLVLKLSFLFTLAPEVLTLIAYTGALTAFMAALVASAQSDIKKVLAYSTVSQLGYMFLALGLGAFSTAMFHLITHGFFKALLFLAAGAVIHGLKGEQNIYRMGALKNVFPWTAFCFLIGFLALIGLPPFSGFFSKDEILWSAFARKEFALFFLSSLTALLTAFYMTRLFILVFCGKPRWKTSVSTLPKEGSFFAKFPLALLAVCSLFSGLIGIPHLLGQYLPFHPPHWIEMYLKPVIAYTEIKGSYLMEGIIMASSSLLVLLVLGVTARFYLYKTQWLKSTQQKIRPCFDLLHSAFKVDEFCHSKIVQPTLNASRELWLGMDVKIINGGIFLIQKTVLSLKEIFETSQSGKTQDYIMFMILGLLICILSVLLF